MIRREDPAGPLVFASMEPRTKPDTQRAVRALLAAARRERDKKLAAATADARPSPPPASPQSPCIEL